MNLFHDPVPVWVVGHDAGGPENALTPRLSRVDDFDPDCDLLAFGQAQIFGKFDGLTMGSPMGTFLFLSAV
jgi:hypothetical protein